MPLRFSTSLAVLFAGCSVHAAVAQTATIVEFPDPALFYQNTTFFIDGGVGYVPSFDNDTLWSFSMTTGELLDPDGLALPAPGTASDPYVFPNGRLALPGWFPEQGLYFASVSDPADMKEEGFIGLGPNANVQGQNIAGDCGCVVGFIASFPNDTLYSFNAATLELADPDGLLLPGNPDRIAWSVGRVAIVDTTNGRIIVANVLNPAAMELAGVIELPQPATFGSNDNIVFAADSPVGFVSTNERVLYSFNVETLQLLDPDGIAFGNQQFGDHIAIHGDVVACVWSRGLSFIDVSDPADMTLISNGNFGGTVAPQGNATVAFSVDGSRAAVPVVYPGNLVYTFEVATGEQVSPPLAVDDQPNYLTVYGGNEIAVLCSGNDADNVWLIDGLLGVFGDINGDGAVDVLDLLLLLAAWGDCPPPPGACPADLNGDGTVDVLDLLLLLANWS